MAGPVSDIEEKKSGSAESQGWDSLDSSTEASLSSLKDQTAQTANEARLMIAAVAEEARIRIGEIVDQQKAAGAEQVAGIAHAAKTAADDLQKTNPQMAQVMRITAAGIDRVASDIKANSVRDIVVALSDFGRRRPMAFFGGAVVVGLVLSRFLKSDTSPGAAGMSALDRSRV